MMDDNESVTDRLTGRQQTDSVTMACLLILELLSPLKKQFNG